MRAIRFEAPLVPGEDAQPGDRWIVESVDRHAGTMTFTRLEATPDQYRSPKDGLHPRVPSPDVRPITAEEARKLADEMDAALDRGRADMRAWAFNPDNPINQVNRALATADEGT